MGPEKTNEAKILFSLIKERYGDRVTAEELEERRKGLEAILDASATMKIVKLENGDEPYPFFKPHGGKQ
jgi:ATP-dependent DNA ligase